MFHHLKTDLIALIRMTLYAGILSLLAAAILHYTPLAETCTALISSIILALSVLLGGFYAAGQIGKRGIFQGLRVSLAFFLLLTLYSLFFSSSELTLARLLPTLTLILSSGAIGGILGVDARNQYRKSHSRTRNSHSHS